MKIWDNPRKYDEKKEVFSKMFIWFGIFGSLMIISDFISLIKSIRTNKIPFFISCNPHFVMAIIMNSFFFVLSLECIELYQTIYPERIKNRNKVIFLIFMSLLWIGILGEGMGEIMIKLKMGLPAAIFFLLSIYIFIWLSFSAFKFLREKELKSEENSGRK